MTKQFIYLLTLIPLLLVQTFVSFSQNEKQAKADELYNQGNFIQAVLLYESLISESKDNSEYYKKAGICYLSTNIDKFRAIPHLEKALELQSGDKDSYYHLGKAYQYNYKFDQAIKSFNKHIELNGSLVEKAKREIEMCFNAKVLIKQPVAVSFENAGPLVNSEFPDYYPFITKEHDLLVFTSRRKGGVGSMLEFDGFYPSDIWLSQRLNGKFQKAQNAGPLVNSSYDEQCVGLSDSGDEMFVYIDHVNKVGDIYNSSRPTKSFQKLVKLGSNVNSKNLETSGSLSKDGNTLFYASVREEGLGGRDLYMSRKLPTGEWGQPQSLGPAVNTKYNEDFPTLSDDGLTLYFASDGHPGMGGYDVFKSKWNPAKNFWSPPKNIGYPLNTPADDMVISFTKDERVAYVSMLRPEGLGDLDIYKVTFTEKDPLFLILKVDLFISGSEGKTVQNGEIKVSSEDGTLIGNYLPNVNTNKLTIILNPGEYILDLSAADYKTETKKLSISDDDCYQQTKSLSFIMKRR